jgi:hypothetical protein
MLRVQIIYLGGRERWFKDIFNQMSRKHRDVAKNLDNEFYERCIRLP